MSRRLETATKRDEADVAACLKRVREANDADGAVVTAGRIGVSVQTVRNWTREVAKGEDRVEPTPFVARAVLQALNRSKP